MRKYLLLRQILYSLLLCFSASMIPVSAQDMSAEQHFRAEYKGKTLLLRNFYSGNSLAYDSTITPSGKAVSGDWTIDGVVRIDDLSLADEHLIINAERQYLGWVGGSFQPLADKSEQKDGAEKVGLLRIEVAIGRGTITAEKLDNVFSEIFLTSADNLAELVPVYWKPCVMAALQHKHQDQYGCRFSPGFMTIPGIAQFREDPKSEKGTSDAAKASSGERVLWGRDAIPPHAVSAPDPNMTLEATQMKYHATARLGLTVDKTGTPTDILIIMPAGCGLDREAVDTIGTWKFQPAQKDGKAVGYAVTIEVQFRSN